MLRRALIAACLLALPMTAQPQSAAAAERTKEELKALKKVMKKWSKALGVKCKHCHNTKDFSEWTARREVGMAMQELFGKKLKPLEGTTAVTCGDCHSKSLKTDEAGLKRFGLPKVKALASDFKARGAAAKTDGAKETLAEVAKYLEGL